jgi:hypothetical protein
MHPLKWINPIKGKVKYQVYSEREKKLQILSYKRMSKITQKIQMEHLKINF